MRRCALRVDLCQRHWSKQLVSKKNGFSAACRIRSSRFAPNKHGARSERSGDEGEKIRLVGLKCFPRFPQSVPELTNPSTRQPEQLSNLRGFFSSAQSIRNHLLPLV